MLKGISVLINMKFVEDKNIQIKLNVKYEYICKSIC